MNEISKRGYRANHLLAAGLLTMAAGEQLIALSEKEMRIAHTGYTHELKETLGHIYQSKKSLQYWLDKMGLLAVKMGSDNDSEQAQAFDAFWGNSNFLARMILRLLNASDARDAAREQEAIYSMLALDRYLRERAPDDPRFDEEFVQSLNMKG